MFFGLVLVLAAQEVHRHCWHDGSGPSIGSQHGEADRFGQRYEEEFRHARKEKHGKENDANAQRGNERRHGDLLSAIENRLDRFLAHGQIAIDVLDFHGGVVHQDADGQCQTAQRHDVDGFAESAEHQNADENRKWNGNRDDQRALPVSEEDQNHHCRQARGDQGLAQDSLDGCAHEKRLIKERRDAQALGQRRRVVLQDFLDAVDDIERRSAAGLVSGHEHAALPVHADNIGLRAEAVANVSDVFHVNRRAVHGFYRQIVQPFHRQRASVHLDEILKRTQLHGSRGQDQILRVDRVYDVHWRKAPWTAGRRNRCPRKPGAVFRRREREAPRPAPWQAAYE